MRGRNLHSRSTTSKGGSQEAELLETIALDKQTVSDISPSKAQKIRKSDSFTAIVKKELQTCCNKQNTYNGLVNILKNPAFLVACYEEIRGKPGNMTKGSIKGTLDDLTWEWFEDLGRKLARGQFTFSPARRVMIPKANGKERPLGINSPREKIVQKALVAIMEQIWEPIFSPNSHGFRPNRSVHSALETLYLQGGNYTWVIQGDISKCFDNIPHDIIMDRISKKIKCARTLELIKKALKAGYVDPDTGSTVKGYLGTPQGSVLSPLLSNIVLHELDSYMEDLRKSFNKGKYRQRNTEYNKLELKRRRTEDPDIRKECLLAMRKLTAYNPNDPNFRRLLYVRYADDFVVLVIGSHKDAMNIRRRIKDVLSIRCGLSLNLEKTEINNIQEEGFNFLGAWISRANMRKNSLMKTKSGIRRRMTTRMRVYIDSKKVYKKLVDAKLAKTRHGNIVPRGTAKNAMINLSHYEIVSFFNSKIHGLLNFFSFAGNREKLWDILWILKESCALTLAKKYKTRSRREIFSRFGKDLKCPETDVKLYSPNNLNAIHDYKRNSKVETPNNLEFLNVSWSDKLTESNINKLCAICGTSTDIEMHHLRKVKNIRQKIRTGDSTFSEWKGAYLRKQIPLCSYHHRMYHKGELNYWDLNTIKKFTKGIDKNDAPN
jgi:group II intron reverse transcriptase/maturase